MKLFTLPAIVLSALLWTLSAVASAPTQVLVEGMTCSACVKSVKAAFGKHSEVKTVDVDVKKGTVTITFQPEKTLTEQQIRDTVKDAGYKVTKVSMPQSS